MSYQEVKKMVQEWIITNKRPMTADDAQKLAGDDIHALNGIYTAACYFAHNPGEASFRKNNHFDVKFMFKWVEFRHGPQPCIFEC